MSQNDEIDELVGQLKSEDFLTRKRAGDSLIKIGKPAIESLTAALEDTDQEVRETAAVLLIILKPPLNYLPAIWKIVEKMDGMVGLSDSHALLSMEHPESKYKPGFPIPEIPSTPMDAFTVIMDIFMALRSLDIKQALLMATKARTDYPKIPLLSFMEGILAYAMRSDAIALEQFRESLHKVPLFAEAPYYLGQILVETAIDDYSKNHPGGFSAETALLGTKKYDEAMAAFAWAEMIGQKCNLKSIQEHLTTYKMLLSIDHFSGMQMNLPTIDVEYTTPEKWLYAIGQNYKNQQFERLEMLADFIGSLLSESCTVFVVGRSSFLSPFSMLLSRRKEVNVFEVGPRTTDDMVKDKLLSMKGNTVILTDPRRTGFGKYFSWIPANAKTVEVVLINQQDFLSVEFFGLLARLQFEDSKKAAIHFTLAICDLDNKI
jgi:hypothetical protein